MLTVMHILGNEPHESIQRNIYDESSFFIDHGVDIRFAYDPRSRLAQETDIIESLHKLGAPIYQLPYLPPARNGGPRLRFSPLRAALTLREMCVAFPVDVIHTHAVPAYKLACAARFFGAPIVHIYTVHAIAEQDSGDNFLNRVVSAWCDELIAIDGYTAGVLLDRLINVTKIKRVNYGIDLQKWKMQTDNISEAGRQTNSDGNNQTRDVFTLLMIADSDPIGDGTAYDAFADLILRLMHDFEPSQSGFRRIRFIIAANSEYGLRYARELIITLDLSDNVEICCLSDVNRIIGYDNAPSEGPDNNGFLSAPGATNGGNGDVYGTAGEMRAGALEGAKTAEGANTVASGAAGAGVMAEADLGTGAAGVEYGDIHGVGVMRDGDAADDGAKESAWTSVRVGNWVEAEAKIKLRSFKYKTGGEIIRHAKYNVYGDKKLFSNECETSRRLLYNQADLCLYHSENRFFPYPAAETIAMGIPTLTNDINFFAQTLTTSGAESAVGVGETEVAEGAEIAESAERVEVAEVAEGSEVAEVAESAEVAENTTDATDAASDSEAFDGAGAGAGQPETESAAAPGIVDFTDPNELAYRILKLIHNRAQYDALATVELELVRARYDIDDMIMGIYDSYVKGLRV